MCRSRTRSRSRVVGWRAARRRTNSSSSSWPCRRTRTRIWRVTPSPSPTTRPLRAAAPRPRHPPAQHQAPSSQPLDVSGAKLPVKEFITFDQPHKIDGLSKKLEEFNTKQPDESMFAPQLKQTVVAKAWAETTDLGKTEQLSLSISYLNNGVKKERFLMFIEVKLTQTDDLNNKLIQLQPPLRTAC